MPLPVLWFVFMSSERQPKCLQECGEFSSSVFPKPEFFFLKEKEKKRRKRNKLVSKALGNTCNSSISKTSREFAKFFFDHFREILHMKQNEGVSVK